jgi:Flp pilus assembly protein TadB
MFSGPSSKEYAMTDPYRIPGAPEAPRTAGGSGIVRPVLWLLLVVSAVANVVTSTAHLNPLVGAGFGLIALACATALIVHHRRLRRR